MKIIRTYLLKEMLQPTIMAFMLFTFILLVGNLVKLADLLVNKGVSLLPVLQMFGLLIPTLSIYTVPMAVLTGTLLAFGKLSSDREILAMRTSGVSFFAIAWPIILTGIIVSLTLIPINAEVVPWSHFATRKLLLNIGIQNPTAFLEPGTFIKEFKPYILFIYNIDGNKLNKVRIYETQEGQPTRTIVAERGEFISIPEENRVILKLYQGSADQPDPSNPAQFYKLEFDAYAMDLRLNEGQTPRTLGKKRKDMSFNELRQEKKRLAQKDVDTTPLDIELGRRFSLAFSPLAFILIGLPLGITTRRAQKSIGLGLSVLVFLGYYLFLALGQALAQKALMPAQLAMWLGNMVLFILGTALILRTQRT